MALQALWRGKRGQSQVLDGLNEDAKKVHATIQEKIAVLRDTSEGSLAKGLNATPTLKHLLRDLCKAQVGLKDEQLTFLNTDSGVPVTPISGIAPSKGEGEDDNDAIIRSRSFVVLVSVVDEVGDYLFGAVDDRMPAEAAKAAIDQLTAVVRLYAQLGAMSQMLDFSVSLLRLLNLKPLSSALSLLPNFFQTIRSQCEALSSSGNPFLVPLLTIVFNIYKEVEGTHLKALLDNVKQDAHFSEALIQVLAVAYPKKAPLIVDYLDLSRDDESLAFIEKRLRNTSVASSFENNINSTLFADDLTVAVIVDAASCLLAANNVKCVLYAARMLSAVPQDLLWDSSEDARRILIASMLRASCTSGTVAPPTTTAPTPTSTIPRKSVFAGKKTTGSRTPTEKIETKSIFSEAEERFASLVDRAVRGYPEDVLAVLQPDVDPAAWAVYERFMMSFYKKELTRELYADFMCSVLGSRVLGDKLGLKLMGTWFTHSCDAYGIALDKSLWTLPFLPPYEQSRSAPGTPPSPMASSPRSSTLVSRDGTLSPVISSSTLPRAKAQASVDGRLLMLSGLQRAIFGLSDFLPNVDDKRFLETWSRLEKEHGSASEPLIRWAMMLSCARVRVPSSVLARLLEAIAEEGTTKGIHAIMQIALRSFLEFPITEPNAQIVTAVVVPAYKCITSIKDTNERVEAYRLLDMLMLTACGFDPVALGEFSIMDVPMTLVSSMNAMQIRPTLDVDESSTITKLLLVQLNVGDAEVQTLALRTLYTILCSFAVNKRDHTIEALQSYLIPYLWSTFLGVPSPLQEVAAQLLLLLVLFSPTHFFAYVQKETHAPAWKTRFDSLRRILAIFSSLSDTVQYNHFMASSNFEEQQPQDAPGTPQSARSDGKQPRKATPLRYLGPLVQYIFEALHDSEPIVRNEAHTIIVSMTGVQFARVTACVVDWLDMNARHDDSLLALQTLERLLLHYPRAMLFDWSSLLFRFVQPWREAPAGGSQAPAYKLSEVALNPGRVVGSAETVDKVVSTSVMYWNIMVNMLASGIQISVSHMRYLKRFVSTIVGYNLHNIDFKSDVQGDAGDERQWYGAVEPLDISSLEPPQRQMLVAFLQGLADILDAGSIVVARESGGRQLAGEPESPFNCFADNILSIFNRSNLACMTHAELRSALNALLILLYKYEPEFAALLDRRSSDKRDRAETTRSLLKTCARELLNFFATNAECSEDNKLTIIAVFTSILELPPIALSLLKVQLGVFGQLITPLNVKRKNTLCTRAVEFFRNAFFKFGHVPCLFVHAFKEEQGIPDHYYVYRLSTRPPSYVPPPPMSLDDGDAATSPSASDDQLASKSTENTRLISKAPRATISYDLAFILRRVLTLDESADHAHQHEGQMRRLSEHIVRDVFGNAQIALSSSNKGWVRSGLKASGTISRGGVVNSEYSQWLALATNMLRFLEEEPPRRKQSPEYELAEADSTAQHAAQFVNMYKMRFSKPDGGAPDVSVMLHICAVVERRHRLAQLAQLQMAATLSHRTLGAETATSAHKPLMQAAAGLIQFACRQGLMSVESLADVMLAHASHVRDENAARMAPSASSPIVPLGEGASGSKTSLGGSKASLSGIDDIVADRSQYKPNPFCGSLQQAVASVLKAAAKGSKYALSPQAICAVVQVLQIDLLDFQEVQELPALDANLLAKQLLFREHLFCRRASTKLMEDIIEFTAHFATLFKASADPAFYRLGRTLGSLLGEMWCTDKVVFERAKVFRYDEKGQNPAASIRLMMWVWLGICLRPTHSEDHMVVSERSTVFASMVASVAPPAAFAAPTLLSVRDIERMLFCMCAVSFAANRTARATVGPQVETATWNAVWALFNKYLQAHPRMAAADTAVLVKSLARTAGYLVACGSPVFPLFTADVTIFLRSEKAVGKDGQEGDLVTGVFQRDSLESNKNLLAELEKLAQALSMDPV